METRFSIIDALKIGWAKTRTHSALVFQVVLTFFVYQVVSVMVERVLNGTGIGVLAVFGLTVLGVFIGTGAMLIALRLARGEKTTYRHILPDYRVVWKFFVAGLCAGFIIMLPGIVAALLVLNNLIAALGFAQLRAIVTQLQFATNPAQVQSLLMPIFTHIGFVGYFAMFLGVVLSTYLALRYSMVRFSVIDGAGITESLRESTKMTHGVKWPLFGFSVLLIVINIIGSIPFGLGLLITAPISLIAYAHVYDKLAR
jgi:uncharacterized membrane protein